MSNLIYKKMSEVMKDIGHVGKDQKNVAQGFKFRGIDQFVNAAHPALIKAGLFIAPKVISTEYTLKDVVRSNGKTGVDKHVNLMVEYTFFAEDGSNVVIGPIPGEAIDSGDKATTKALSAALKYMLIQTFSVPTEDMVDADSDSPSLTGEQTEPIKFKPTIDQTVAVLPKAVTTGLDTAPTTNAIVIGTTTKLGAGQKPTPKKFEVKRPQPPKPAGEFEDGI